MKIHQQTGDIYLLSLDTFMIMAVMGITLGIMFFVLNPSLALGPPPVVTTTIKYELSNEQFLELENEIPENNKYESGTLWLFEKTNGQNVKESLKIRHFFIADNNIVKLSIKLTQDNNSIKNEAAISQVINQWDVLSKYLIDTNNSAVTK